MSRPPSRALVITAFAAVYVIWGSSYIGIHFAIETIPPFLMTTARFLLAGGLLMGWALARGASLPTRVHWRAAAIVGAFLFLFNNTAIVWAEVNGVPTGMVAVLIATMPMWMVLLTWLKPRGVRPSAMTLVGLAIGFVGIVLLVRPDSVAPGGEPMHPLGPFVVLFGAFAWAFGSLYARGAALPGSATMSTGIQLLAGGAMIGVVSVVNGDAAQLDVARVTLGSLLAFLHLTFSSSIVAFSAFVWLMKVCPPAKVATYAYVNPVIAVMLGWLLLREPITPRTLVAAAVIIAGVIIINIYGSRPLPRLRLRSRERSVELA
jgi:drug/metabolite transporter (DMT)-like permease